MKDSIALKKHFEWKGKYEIKVKCPVSTLEELAICYTPGVADACMAIFEHPELSYSLTGRGNQVAVITDGTAILGLGNIGPEAGMPVMEGKCALFKNFGDIDAFPLCLRTTDPDEIVKTVKILEGNFAGINLEDIAAPRCFEIESRLRKELNIPVFHDDQHGTAIVVGAAIINAMRYLKKDIHDLKVAMSGAGAAGTAIGKYLVALGVKDVIMVEKDVIIDHDTVYTNEARKELATMTNKENRKGNLAKAMEGANVFIGVSVGNIVTKEMIQKMAKDPIVFALANPIPEISYQDAIEAGAIIVGTGSSKNPNQINNALVFPGLFRGAIDAKATDVTDEMKIATSYAIAESVSDEELKKDHILPYVIDKKVHQNIAKRVCEAWKKNQ